jgi:glucokinase
VAEAVGRHTEIVNDARAFGLAELHFGAARGAVCAAGLVLGTGVGGALIVDGRLVTGRTGGAGEIGHQILQANGPVCRCGNHGCLEALARSDVFAARAGVAGVPELVSAFERGDPRAQAAAEVTAHWIAIGLANVITLINPEVVFLGGGVMLCGEILLGPIRRFLPGLTPFVDPESYRVVPGQLGPLAGALGAVAWAWECARDTARTKS